MEIFQDGELEEAMRKSDNLHANSLSSWWRLFCESYEELIQSITNPVRASYTLADLGETSFTVTPRTGAPFTAVREDLQLANARKEVLECSFWRRTDSPSRNNSAAAISGTAVATHWRESVSSTTYARSSVDSLDSVDELQQLSPAAYAAASADPCIVYLHDMSSSRKECVYLRDAILAAGFSFFALDLSGSGMSEGDRVSFGHFEQDDVRAVLDHLYATGRASRVGIWGRGIGGAAALLHLRHARSVHYKSLLLTKAQALALQIVYDTDTGKLLCVRPSSLRLPFRCTRADVSNGDFELLSIGNIPVAGLSLSQCQQRIRDAADARVRIAGFAKADREAQDPFVFALTMDCTFGDMEQVIADMIFAVSASAQRRDLVFPSAMLSAASKIIGRSVRKTGGFSVGDVHVLDDVPHFTYPSLFLCATKKDFIAPSHTQALHARYGGRKDLVQFAGVHEQNRPRDVVDQVTAHFAAALALSTAAPASKTSV